MKPLQNNYTTPEQSKRLLELGLPADSADLGIIDDVMNKDIEVLHIPYSQWCKGYENICVPCWSVGRLIEIDIICHKAKETSWKMSMHSDGTHTNLLGLVYREFVSSALVGDYDFSKLEE